MAEATLDDTTISISTPPVRAPKAWFRGDVDGLRAVAILLVVAYHAGIGPLHGGFIGVDIFLVISGFLISRKLLVEVEASGRVSLPSFWARRIRRLVPALALVVVVTLAVGFKVMPLFERGDLAAQGGTAALYVSNIQFGFQSQNYFAANVTSSPFLHTWSLGVEEQFYLLWPILFAVVASLVSRRRLGHAPVRLRRQRLISTFAVIFVTSLGFNIWLTQQGSPWAFYSLPTRAWEFAAGGLIAAVPTPTGLRSSRARLILAVGGLAVLGCALVEIDAASPYPGTWATLPVAATVMLIVAGERWNGEEQATVVHQVLSTRPAQWLGRVSYSWYLWHWPAIVLATVALDSDQTSIKVTAALATLPIAWLAYRFYETPIRFARPIARSNPRTYAFGAVVTVVVLLAAIGVYERSPRVVLASSNPSAAPVLDVTQGPPGASLQDQVALVVAQYKDQVNHECPVDAVKSPDGDDYCVGGDLGSSTSLMLIGDSHAGQWRTLLDVIARQRKVKLIIRQHSGCAPYRMNINDPSLAGKNEICQRQADGDVRIVKALKPTAVLIATWSGNPSRIADDAGNLVSKDEETQIWGKGITTLLDDYVADGTRVGFVLDEPTLPVDASACIDKNKSVAACEPSRSDGLAISSQLVDQERSIIDQRHLPRIDLTDSICDADKCHLQIDGTLVYVDSHHLSAAFVAKQRPQMEQLIAQLLP